MSATAFGTWLVVGRLGNQTEIRDALEQYFQVRSGLSIFRQIGGNIRLDYSPSVLEPINTFYGRLNKEFASLGILGKKFPYLIDIHGVKARINCKIHLFPPDIIVLRIELIEGLHVAEPAAEFLQRFQYIAPSIDGMARIILGLLSTGLVGNRSQAPKVYPCTFLFGPGINAVLPKPQVVAALTRHANLKERVVSEVIDKNDAHQIDDNQILADRQGVVGLFNYEPSSHLRRRCESVVSAFELAVAFSALSRTSLDELDVNQRNSVIRAITEPKKTIPNSTSMQRFWQLLASEFALREQLEERLRTIPAKGQEMDVLLVVSMHTEGQKLVSKLGNLQTKNHLGNYYLVGELAGCTVGVHVGGRGNTEAGISTTELVLSLKPKITVFCGIAGGRKDSKIGDVVVSDFSYNYESGKEDPEGFYPRPRISKSTKQGASLVSTFLLQFRGADHYRVYNKPIASGEKVVGTATGQTAELIKRSYGDALAVETEGFGFLKALESLGRPGFVIRGISDELENKESTEDHETAINHVSDFLMQFLTYFSSVKQTPASGNATLSLI